jgi:hypothetical protein
MKKYWFWLHLLFSFYQYFTIENLKIITKAEKMILLEIKVGQEFHIRLLMKMVRQAIQIVG